MTGRPATDDVIPGAFALSVGMPDLPAPDGWRWVKLTDVARLESGHTPSRKHPEYWDGDIQWLGIQDARQHHGREILETRQTISELGIANSSARILPAGTVCLSRTASVGYVVRLGRPMATSQDFVNWVCSEDVEPEYLMYLFIAEADSILRFGKGSTHTTVYFPEVKAFHVCLPPPEEQRRIVAKVEALLARVNAARDRLAHVPGILKRFRQSVLAAACSGRLTEEWRVDSSFPEESVDLGQVLAEIRTGPFGSALHSSDYVESGIPVINPTNLVGGIIVPTASVSVTRDTRDRLAEFVLRTGDIVIARRGEMGRCAVVGAREAGWLCGTGCAVLRPNMRVLPSFLQLVVSSPEARRYLAACSVGSTMQNLNQKVLVGLPVWLPTIGEQREIVNHVEALFALADTIEQRASTALRRIDRLIQSILSKAFRGELVGPSPAPPEGADEE
ncbi:MAG: restriction endonuclease subunit S [Thermoanaerobaculaceae bacterium]|nr:restriction endonuclease subunit S [Thermoanaerobaculaceae bacterium]MDI9621901.1 restriction endonuclease subunit S [Acidobacteriota bacterium]NLH10331.1 hypothetical protein [Holophagae bacterium]